jgi:hypothetical protein
LVSSSGKGALPTLETLSYVPGRRRPGWMHGDDDNACNGDVKA